MAQFLTSIEPQRLREELQEGQTADLRRRRGIIGLSLIGMASMAAVTLLQTGIVRHLPDPPLDSFDSDRVNSSDTAYGLGAPDGTLSLASLASNVPIAALRRRKPSQGDALGAFTGGRKGGR